MHRSVRSYPKSHEDVPLGPNINVAIAVWPELIYSSLLEFTQINTICGNISNFTQSWMKLSQFVQISLRLLKFVQMLKLL